MPESNLHLPPNILLLQKMDYKAVIYAIEAIAYFNIASIIGNGEKTTIELAQMTKTNEDALYRLLRLLAADEIFKEVVPRTFANSEMSTYLRDDIPGSMRAMACMRQTQRYRQEWDNLEEWVRTGSPVVEELCGMPLYEYFKDHKDEEALFDKAMTSFSSIVERAIAVAYDFAGVVVDVGGGRGSLLTTIHKYHPNIQGVLFDRPSVIERMKDEVTDAPYEPVAGDFFAGVPPNGDIYILKEVLHNWSDQECVTILQHCLQAMKSTGSILICEQRIDPANERGLSAKWLDILMGLEQRGRERTEEEFNALFNASGLKLVRSIQTASPHWIFEAAQE